MATRRRSARTITALPRRTANARCWFLGALLTGLAGMAAWRIVAIAEADRSASSDPRHALRWQPDHPQARLTLAQRQLVEGRLDEAKASARRLLASEPLEGRGFVVLAQAEAQQRHPRAAAALYAIAARRSPRDLRAHAWLAEYLLVAGHYADALKHVDAILRVAPPQADTLLPMLVRLAADPRFANALAMHLQSDPPWRAHLLARLLPAAASPTNDRLMSMLSSAGTLTDRDVADWIDRLMRQDRWNKAYGVWASHLEPRRAELAMVFNGDFEQQVSGSGFDWQRAAIAGVSTQLASAPGARGLAAHVTFRGRPVPQVDLQHPLLLVPGRYRFSVRMRAQALPGDSGLEWSVTCDGQTEPIAASEPLAGSFAWREVSMDVIVPDGCRGQWLRLRTAAAGGFARQISGEIWFDDAVLSSRHDRRGTAPGAGASVAVRMDGAVLRAERGRVLLSQGAGFAEVAAPTVLAAGDRVLVPQGSIASLDYGERCRRLLDAADVHVVGSHCPAPSTGSGDAPPDAARLAASLGLARAILERMAPGPPIPAGR